MDAVCGVFQEFQDDLDRDLNELSEQVDKELEKSGDLVSG